MPDVSVIVPARDAERTLPRTLRALAGQRDAGEFEVIVVDDGSVDRTAQVARQADGAVRLLRRSPAGPGAARNAGVAAAGGRLLAFCDADVFPTTGWLAAGARALEGADLVQGRVLPDPHATLGPFDRTLWIGPQARLWEAANLFVRRELFERVGGFGGGIHPRSGKPLAEDVWFGWRAVRAGARTAFCPEALAHHAVHPRRARGYVAERWRLRFFPAIVRAVPELRHELLCARAFLNSRSARFDLALAGAGLALRAGSPLPLLASLPYLRLLRAAAGRAPGRAPAAVAAVALADAAADAVGFAALLAGSLVYRSPVL